MDVTNLRTQQFSDSYDLSPVPLASKLLRSATQQGSWLQPALLRVATERIKALVMISYLISYLSLTINHAERGQCAGTQVGLPGLYPLAPYLLLIGLFFVVYSLIPSIIYHTVGY